MLPTIVVKYSDDLCSVRVALKIPCAVHNLGVSLVGLTSLGTTKCHEYKLHPVLHLSRVESSTPCCIYPV